MPARAPAADCHSRSAHDEQRRVHTGPPRRAQKRKDERSFGGQRAQRQERRPLRQIERGAEQTGRDEHAPRTDDETRVLDKQAGGHRRARGYDAKRRKDQAAHACPHNCAASHASASLVTSLNDERGTMSDEKLIHHSSLIVHRWSLPLRMPKLPKRAMMSVSVGSLPGTRSGRISIGSISAMSSL